MQNKSVISMPIKYLIHHYPWPLRHAQCRYTYILYYCFKGKHYHLSYIFHEYKICNSVYILSVYSPFSDRVGLSFHNTPFPGVLMKSIGAAVFDRMPFLTSTTFVGCNMCYVFNVNVTDSFNDRRCQCRLIQ